MALLKQFSEQSGLRQEIQEDVNSALTSANRYPIRLIFLPSFLSLQDLVKDLDDFEVNRVELSDLLCYENAWLTVDEIVQAMEQSMEGHPQSVILTLSEIIRFFSKDDFTAVFQKISELESPVHLRKRIYVPLVGLSERFVSNFFNSFYRQREWAPIWQLVPVEPIRKAKLYITPFKIVQQSNYKVLEDTRQWLNSWKSNPVDPVICCSLTLSLLYKNALPDQIFDIELLFDRKQLVKRLFDIDLTFDYMVEHDVFWDKLIQICIENPGLSLEQLLRKVMNVATIDTSDVINTWSTSEDDFKKWLLKAWFLGKNEFKRTYLHKVLGATQTLEKSEFCKNLWLQVFDSSDSNAYWEERETLLKLFYKYNPSFPTAYVDQVLPEKIAALDKDKQIKALTGLIDTEKGLLISLLIGGQLAKSLLVDKYEELEWYLANLDLDDMNEQKIWINDYFRKYKFSKLSDKIDPELSTLLATKNSGSEAFYNWYYSFKTVAQLLVEEKHDRVVWIDALGFEWAPYIVNILERQMGFVVEKKFVARANIPSITDNNRIPGATYIQDFDQIIHSDYKHPQSLIKQLSLVKTLIMNKIYVSDGQTVAIVSDHGTTALARLQENVKTYNFADSSHEGRCMWVKDKFMEDKDVIIHETDLSGEKKTCLIALRYTSLYNRPKHEVHGGGTPEEVLVPVLFVSKTKATVPQTFSVSPTVVKLSVRKPVLSLSIKPMPPLGTKPSIQFKNKKIGELQLDKAEERWKLTLVGFKSGSYELTLKVGASEHLIKIELAGGLKETDLL